MQKSDEQEAGGGSESNIDSSDTGTFWIFL